ncbi:MAG TPA: response regulator transcription factor [Bacteroidetes bacterium]|nr:response regulator transcription factor [Bacteroidota bacterium]
MIRLIITDDHPIVRDGIKRILATEKGIKIVAYVKDGTELMQKLEKVETDVILMDINMPGMNGIEATQLVRKKYPNIKVLCFSQYDEKRFVKLVLKRGANGYLLKNAAATELILAIKTILGGNMYLSEELPNIFDEKQNKQSNYSNMKITSRERDVLNEICNEKSNHEIARLLLISHNTVETHRANLLLKVGVKNTAGLVRWAVENNIV